MPCDASSICCALSRPSSASCSWTRLSASRSADSASASRLRLASCCFLDLSNFCSAPSTRPRSARSRLQ
eukprot:4220457-Pyramimonas_sp.AAC.1